MTARSRGLTRATDPEPPPPLYRIFGPTAYPPAVADIFVGSGYPLKTQATGGAGGGGVYSVCAWP